MEPDGWAPPSSAASLMHFGELISPSPPGAYPGFRRPDDLDCVLVNVWRLGSSILFPTGILQSILVALAERSVCSPPVGVSASSRDRF